MMGMNFILFQNDFGVKTGGRGWGGGAHQMLCEHSGLFAAMLHIYEKIELCT